MKSASYMQWACEKCYAHRRGWSKPKGPLFASSSVVVWVKSKVETSRYIWERSGGCSGCADVYEERARVLANLLWKLGVKI